MATRASHAALAGAIVGVALAAQPISLLTGDSWFCVLFGREIVERGLPVVNEQTLAGLGSPWRDAQWLAHLVAYAAHAIGGTWAAASLRVAIGVAIGAIAALATGRVAGRTIAAVALGAAIHVTSTGLRAQAIADPILALTLALLAGVPTRARAAAVLALLAIHANLHGSVVVAIGLALIRAILVLRVRGDRGVATILALSPLTVLATPLGLGAIDAWARVAGSVLVDRYMTEWQPASPLDVPQVWIGLAIAIATLARDPQRASSLESPALVVLGLLACAGARHAGIFGVACMVLLPRALDRGLGDRLSFDALARPVPLIAGAGACALLVIGGGWLSARAHAPDDRAIRAAGEALEPEGRAFTTLGLGDRLIVAAPHARVRVFCDARAELLSEDDLAWLADLASARPSAEAIARLERFDVLAIDDREAPVLGARLLDSRAWVEIDRGAHVLALRRRAR